MVNLLPSASDVINLVEAFDRHPLGAFLLCLLVIVVAAGIRAYRMPPPGDSSARRKRAASRSQKRLQA